MLSKRVQGAGGANAPKFIGERGINYSGYRQTAPNWVAGIDYITIATTGNAANFGNAVPAVYGAGGASGQGRAVFGGGTQSAAMTGAIDYITISTLGNSVDFGSLTIVRTIVAGLSNGISGFFVGGQNLDGSVRYNTIDYVTILTTGNAIDFGDILTLRSYIAGISGTTRGLYAGGQNSAGTIFNIIEYFTTAAPSNAIDFGDLTVTRFYASGGSNGVRGLICGGDTSFKVYSNVIDYVTIATTGNAIDFGDLTVPRGGAPAVACSSTRCVTMGGQGTTSASYAVNVIDYVTINTPGNAIDFGDLTLDRYNASGVSGN